MKFKKPDFWDLKKPNIIAYLLFPIMYFIKIIKFINEKEKIKTDKIKTICVGNIYLGGTGKTPISIKINKIISNLNYSTVFIKKKYDDQFDELELLKTKGNVLSNIDRKISLAKAENSKSAVRRLIQSKGIRINKEIIDDEKFLIQKKSFDKNNFIKLSIGKKKHIKIKLT